LSERVLDKIGKLLAQAEGTTNEHEADAFVSRAQELATTYAVDLELARTRQAAKRLREAEPGAGFEQRRLRIGEKGRRGNRQLVVLYVAVAQVNDVLVNVAQDSTFVLGFGHSEDLDVVEQLWASLATQMAGAASRRLRAGEHQAAGVAAVSWRLSFYEGWLHSVQQRLSEARARALAQHAEAASPGEVSGALVLRAKAERVLEFHDRESQARGSWRGGRRDTHVHGTAWRAGEQDGRNARLGGPELAPRRALG
jgi:hypothetical protein